MNPQSPTNGEKNPEPGLINYQQGEMKKTIAYYHKDVMDSKSTPRLGDKVEFNIVQVSWCSIINSKTFAEIAYLLSKAPKCLFY